MFHLERESQLRATQEEAQKRVDDAWAQVKELQQRENHLKVRSVSREEKMFSIDGCAWQLSNGFFFLSFLESARNGCSYNARSGERPKPTESQR